MIESAWRSEPIRPPWSSPLYVEVRIPQLLQMSSSHPRNRVRSASVGRDKRSDLQARYWAFLFQNLRRSVDDLYTTCEADDSIPAAKEVILILENYVRDFKNLTDWLKLKWDYENTPPPNRPQSLTWDVRMTHSISPKAYGSLLMTSSSSKRHLETPGVIKEVLSPEQENKSLLEETSKEGRKETEDKNTLKEDASSKTEVTVKSISKTEETVDTSSTLAKTQETQVSPLKENKNTHSTLAKSEKTQVNPLKEEKNTSSTLAKTEKTQVELLKEEKNITSTLAKTEKTQVDSLKEEKNNRSSTLAKTEKTQVEPLKEDKRNYPAPAKTTEEEKPQVNLPKENESTFASKTKEVKEDKTNTTKSSSPDCTEERVTVKEDSKKTCSAKTEDKITAPSSSILAKAEDSKTVNKSKSDDSTKAKHKSEETNRSSKGNRAAEEQSKAAKTFKQGSFFSKEFKSTALKPPEVGSKVVNPATNKTDETNKSFQSSKHTPRLTSTRPRSSLVLKRPLNNGPSTKSKPVFKPPSSSNTVCGGGLPSPKATLGRSKTSLSPKNQRVSLVARQGLKSGSHLKSSGEKGPPPPPKTTPSRPGPVRSVSNIVRPSRKYNNSLGSNSSVHSSSSIRSWAETVKGSREEVYLGSSVDNLMREAGNTTTLAEEEDGWKTVKSKSRSRNSLSQKQGGYNAKARFRLPSSAASLPCLLSEEPEDDEKENKADNNHHNKVKKTNSFGSRKGVHGCNSFSKKESSSSSSSSLSKVNEGLSSNESVCGIKKDGKLEVKELTEESVRAHNESLNVAIAKAEVAILQAEEEEENLVREIIETEKAELTEDTDGDTDVDKRSDSASSTNEVASLTSSSMTAASTNTPPISFEGLSWVEQIELEDQMESARYPGRAIQLHEKLSSPARKKEPHEAFKAHQEKHIRAQARRSKFQEEKASKLSALNTRILEVMAKKDQLIAERSDMILDKVGKAEVKRMEHIEGIRKKAHDEDAKLKEIAFINELQAQNTRIEVMVHNQTSDEKCEGRLAELAEERAKKAEQREAKEARAVERRREMELKRIKDVEKLKERIRSREERIEEEQKQQRKDRIEAAREKARDREERLSTVRAAEQDMKEELQEKIALKQEIAAKRHKERLEIIRTKAFELSVQRGLKDDDSSVPCLQPYEPRKKCEICGVLILNEVQLLSHIRGRLHSENVQKANEGRLLSKEEIQNCNVTRIVDAGENELDPRVSQKKERAKSMKKRAKKTRHRLLTRGVECEKAFSDSAGASAPNRAKIGRALKDIEKLLNSQGKGSWPNSSVSTLDRSLGEISRSFDKRDAQDQSAFYHFEGFTYLTKIFNLLAEQKNSCIIPLKSICCVAKICSEACVDHHINTEYLFMSNSLILIAEILRERLDLLVLQGGEEDNDFHHLPDWPIVEPVAQSILDLLTVCLNELGPLVRKAGKKTELISRVQDQISYIISIGIVDRLAGYFHKVQDSIDNKPEVGEFILSTLRFLSSLLSVVEEVICPDNPSAIAEDPTQLFATLRYTDLVGLVSMLYGMLLHQDRPPRDTLIKFPEHILKVTFAAARLLHRMVRTDLEMVQDVLGSEGISLEFRHIASYLLWYCLAQEDNQQRSLLHEIIILVGYFAARHRDNQVIVKSGNQPSILQQLCILPFPYFSQPSLKRILFPTLLACCHENKENHGILSEELNWSFIDDFIKAPDGRSNHLVQLVFSQLNNSSSSSSVRDP